VAVQPKFNHGQSTGHDMISKLRVISGGFWLSDAMRIILVPRAICCGLLCL
jgi:hypothetical protein